MRYFCPSAIFGYYGGQNGGYYANIEVKNQKSAKINEIYKA